LGKDEGEEQDDIGEGKITAGKVGRKGQGDMKGNTWVGNEGRYG